MSRRTHPVLVRRACVADLDLIERLTRHLQEYERRLRPTRSPGRLLPRSYVEGLFRKDSRNTGRLFVAAMGTRVVGFLACLLESEVLERDALRLRISDLIVAVAWRRSGVAAALISAAEGFARGKGAQWVEITALTQNAAARRAYRALRFHESAVTFERRLTARQRPDRDPPVSQP